MSAFSDNYEYNSSIRIEQFVNYHTHTLFNDHKFMSCNQYWRQYATNLLLNIVNCGMNREGYS